MKATKYKSRKPDEAGFVEYSPSEHKIWQQLIERQLEIVKTRACDDYLKGLALLDFPEDCIPQLPDINKKLKAISGWVVEPVPALIGFDRFFRLLSERKFPCATFIRIPQELEYIEEPDIFHELFGHCPMLTHPVYADFMQQYGKLGIGQSPYVQKMLARFYWFTVEFGLINSEKGIKCYGGGILSSIGETVYALDSNKPKRLPFDVMAILRTPYRIDIMQPLYYVIDSYEQIYDVLKQDFIAKIDEAKALGEFDPLYPPKSEGESYDNCEKVC
ncbi:MAG: phenylalanine 4-monooxygenase [Francisellaceae bacterium]